MSTDVYNPQSNDIEDRILEVEGEEVNEDLFYEQYPSITKPGVGRQYQEGKIDYISLPVRSLKNPEVKKYLLSRITDNPESFLSDHAIEAHPRNAKFATKILHHQSVHNPQNISCKSRTPEANKKQEATRVTLSTHKPVEVKIKRHIHLQMVLELVQQIKEGKTENHIIQKSLKRLAKTSPGYATMICCLLRYYSPKITQLQVGYEDIFNIIPSLKENRFKDHKMIQDIAKELKEDSENSKDDIPTIDRIEKVTSILEERFPEEEKNLKAQASFKEKIFPYLVLESAYNIIQDLCHKNDVPFDSNLVKKLNPQLEETVTCKIVTAYLKNIPKTSHGPTSVMLTEKTLSQLTEGTTK